MTYWLRILSVIWCTARASYWTDLDPTCKIILPHFFIFFWRGGDSLCSSTPLLYRVPQWSILAPLLFLIYLLQLGTFKNIYAPVKAWMLANFLSLNENKTDLFIQPSNNAPTVPLDINSLRRFIKQQVTNLGTTLDPCFKKVKKVVQKYIFFNCAKLLHLNQSFLWKIWELLFMHVLLHDLIIVTCYIRYESDCSYPPTAHTECCRSSPDWHA